MSTYEEAREQERVLRKLLDEGRASSDELDELERFMKRVLNPRKNVEEEKRRRSGTEKILIEEKIETPSLPIDVDSMVSIEHDVIKQNIPTINEKDVALAEKFIEAQYVRERELDFENHSLRVELEDMNARLDHIKKGLKKLEHGTDLKIALEDFMDEKNTPAELEMIESEIEQTENECKTLVSTLRKRQKRLEDAHNEYKDERKARDEVLKEVRASVPKDLLRKMLK